jgi:hypothetical protein
MVALPAVLASMKNVLPPVFVMTAVPPVLKFANSVNPPVMLLITALPAVLEPTKNMPWGPESVKVGAFEELLTIPAPTNPKKELEIPKE